MGIMDRLFGGPGLFESRRRFEVAAAGAREGIKAIRAAERSGDSDPPESRDSGDFDDDAPPVSVAAHP
jgi:hypothetical protein